MDDIAAAAKIVFTLANCLLKLIFGHFLFAG